MSARMAAVITCSDGCANGTRPDRSGPILLEAAAAWGFSVGLPVVVPDDESEIAAALRTALDAGARLVLTTGGTGVGPRDRTPEATGPLLSRALPGIPEALRAAGRGGVPTAVLSRGLAGVAGRALVVNLPGSTGGARDGVQVLAPLVDHVLDQLDGGGHA